jgi:hypothetical protein
MIDVNWVLQTTLSILVTEQQGNLLNIPYFNQLLELVNYKYYDNTYKPKMIFGGGYEKDNDIMDTLSFLIKRTYQQIDTVTGKMPCPSDYAHISAITHHYTEEYIDNQELPATRERHATVSIIMNGQFNLRRDNAIVKPKKSSPICTLYGTDDPLYPNQYYQFEPKNLVTVELEYLRYPVTPVWVGTFDATTDTYIYNAAASTQIEFPDIDKYKFIGYILSVLGESYQNPELSKYADGIKVEESNAKQ